MRNMQRKEKVEIEKNRIIEERKKGDDLGGSDEGVANLEEPVLAEHDLQLPPRSSHGCGETLEADAIGF